jgi:hypothetical protein
VTGEADTQSQLTYKGDTLNRLLLITDTIRKHAPTLYILSLSLSLYYIEDGLLLPTRYRSARANGNQRVA